MTVRVGVDWRINLTEGCGEGFKIPNEPSVGPTARINTCTGLVPVTTNPAISEWSPEPTVPRVERLIN